MQRKDIKEMKRQLDPEWARENILPFFRGELAGAELEAFEGLLTTDPRLREEVRREREVLETLEGAREASIVRLAHSLLQDALQQGATDIHLAPRRSELAISFRIDGRLEPFASLSRNEWKPVVDRFKLLAQCDLERHDLPQAGRFIVPHQAGEYDVRLAVMPTVFGEHLTLGMVPVERRPPPLERMHLSPRQTETLYRILRQPNGLLVVGGPVGSGKTTLIYGILQHLLDREAGGANLMTLEERVAYRLEGLSQTQVDVDRGLSFAAALRHLLRGCDPDVVFVGDLPDRETLDLAIRTSVTGHLVLTQMTAASALQILEQLREAGASRFQLGSVLIGLIGMRLVRHSCRQCRVEYDPDSALLQSVGLEPGGGAFLRGAGCDACSGSGYHGRLPFYEMVEVDEEVRKKITAGEATGLLGAALFPGETGSLPDAGRKLVREGHTTAEELRRVLVDYPYFDR